MLSKTLCRASINIPKSIDEMLSRIHYNLNFKYHCEKLKYLNDKPYISFVIPTKNEASYLPKQLISIKYIVEVCKTPAEVIVVDYESTDDTADIARNMGARVISADQPGVGYASYIGVLSSKGDIVIRTDADVITTPSAICDVLEVFNRERGKLVAAIGHIYYPICFTGNLIAYVYDKYIRKPYNTTGYFITFRKEIVDRVNFDPKLKANDDWDFGIRAYRILGPESLYYNYYISVLVSSRLIKKKGLLRYIGENMGVIKTTPVPYSQII